jgi:hypothetical protein
MKKLLYLFLTVLIVACSSEDSEGSGETETNTEPSYELTLLQGNIWEATSKAIAFKVPPSDWLLGDVINVYTECDGRTLDFQENGVCLTQLYSGCQPTGVTEKSYYISNGGDLVLNDEEAFDIKYTNPTLWLIKRNTSGSDGIAYLYKKIN